MRKIPIYSYLLFFILFQTCGQPKDTSELKDISEIKFTDYQLQTMNDRTKVYPSFMAEKFEEGFIKSHDFVPVKNGKITKTNYNDNKIGRTMSIVFENGRVVYFDRFEIKYVDNKVVEINGGNRSHYFYDDEGQLSKIERTQQTELFNRGELFLERLVTTKSTGAKSRNIIYYYPNGTIKSDSTQIGASLEIINYQYDSDEKLTQLDYFDYRNGKIKSESIEKQTYNSQGLLVEKFMDYKELKIKSEIVYNYKLINETPLTVVRTFNGNEMIYTFNVKGYLVSRLAKSKSDGKIYEDFRYTYSVSE